MTFRVVSDRAFSGVCCFFVLQIRDEMKTFVLAGHETSASMLNWSLFELMENKELMNKVCTYCPTEGVPSRAMLCSECSVQEAVFD